MKTELRFINKSQGGVANDIVMFQLPVTSGYGEIAVAWKVIRYCGIGWYHPFTFSTDLEVSCSNEFGNHTPRIALSPGQVAALTQTPSGGRRLALTQTLTDASDCEVRNGLARGAIDVNIFNNGQLLARKTAVAPQQKAVFQYRPTLWIGVASQIVEGAALNSAVIDSINTEFSILGVKSADIVLTGGGSGPNSTVYTFSMQNTVMA